MRPSIVIAATAVLIAATGAGYYALNIYPQHQFRARLDQALATLPNGMTGTYKDAHYAMTSRQATLTGLALHGEIAGDASQPFDITIDSVEASDPNLDLAAAWSNAQGSPATLERDFAIPVAGSVILKGLTVHSTIATLSGASVRIDHSRIYPWALLHDGIPSLKDLRVSLSQPYGPKTYAELEPLLRLEAAAMMAVAYDSYAVEDTKVTETLPGVSLAYTVRKLTSAGFDRGVVKDTEAEDIKGDGSTVGTFSIDHLTFGMSDFRAPLVRLVNGEPVAAALLDGIRLGRIEYRGFSVRPQGQAMIHLGGFSIGPMTFAQGAPVSGQMGWTDLSLSRSQLPNDNARDAFSKLGLDTVTISCGIAYDWDVAQRHASVHDTTLKVNELGSLALSVELSDLGTDFASWSQARLAHAKLRFDDASLVDRLLRMGAAQAGVDIEAYRGQIVALVRQQGADANVVSPALLAAGQAAGDFITSPHSLTVELSPAAPVPVMALQRAAATPPVLATLLGLKVSANQP